MEGGSSAGELTPRMVVSKEQVPEKALIKSRNSEKTHAGASQQQQFSRSFGAAAFPASAGSSRASGKKIMQQELLRSARLKHGGKSAGSLGASRSMRSEERRVGKDRRSDWSSDVCSSDLLYTD